MDELIKRSQCIFVVKRLDPTYTTKEIKIHKDIKKYPPYSMIIYHFQIIDILMNKKNIDVEEKINVISANHKSQLFLHRKYYLEGISKSPLYDFYETNVDFNEKDLIIFCNYSDEGYFKFTVDGAYELVPKKRKIARKIKKLKK